MVLKRYPKLGVFYGFGETSDNWGFEVAGGVSEVKHCYGIGKTSDNWELAPLGCQLIGFHKQLMQH